MKKEDLSKKDLEYIKSVYYNKEKSWDERMDELVDFFGKSERTARKWLVELGFKNKESAESEEFKKAKQKKFDSKKKRFIITWAQNATPVHTPFFDNVKAYAKHINASIHVIAGRYKNPTSVFDDEEYDTWDAIVVPFLDANRHNIHKYVSILSDVKVQPTAENPLSGFNGITGQNSCIIGHPRVHLESLPVLEGRIPKLMLTTGACTVANYTDSKAGQKGAFHHTLGFVIVEIKNDEVYFVRQVTATSEGSFCDLFHSVDKSKVTKINNIGAAILGDVHLGQTDESAMKATINLLDALKPKSVMLHDLVDMYTINHHEEKDFVKQYKKEIEGRNKLKIEIDNMLEWLKKMKKYNLVVVRGNHDDMLDRWIIGNSDLKKNNVKNLLEYVEYAKVLLNGEAPKGIIPYIIDNNFKEVKTLGVNDSYQVHGWELGQHGHLGSSGSRGSLEGFRKLNNKIVVGHSHTPGRKDGALSVGTLTKLRMGYNNGASSWLHSNVIIHNNKKAQHIHIIKGEYTTFK